MSEYDAIIQSNRGNSYGSCVRTTTKSTISYHKHQLQPSDTLQGLALKYGTTTEELRRINKLYSSDTIFLKEYLLIPENNIPSTSNQNATEINAMPENNESSAVEEITTDKLSKSVTEKVKKLKNNDHVIATTQDQDAFSFLKQLDSKIMAGKKATQNYKAPDVYSDDNHIPQSTKIFEKNNSDHKDIFSYKDYKGDSSNL